MKIFDSLKCKNVQENLITGPQMAKYDVPMYELCDINIVSKNKSSDIKKKRILRLKPHKRLNHEPRNRSKKKKCLEVMESDMDRCDVIRKVYGRREIRWHKG